MNEKCGLSLPITVRTPDGRVLMATERFCNNPVYLDAFIEGNPGEMPFMASLCSKHYAETKHIDDPDIETWTPIVGVDA